MENVIKVQSINKSELLTLQAFQSYKVRQRLCDFHFLNDVKDETEAEKHNTAGFSALGEKCSETNCEYLLP